MGIEQWKTEAKSIVLVAIRPYGTSSWTLATSLAISDPTRPEAASVIEALKARGTQVWMLSGDNITTARAVASLVGIPQDNILAEVLPSEKAAKITYLQSTLHASDDFSRSSCFYAVRTSGGGRVVLVPEFAALAMALSSISVVLSSLSLRSGLPLMGFRAKRG